MEKDHVSSPVAKKTKSAAPAMLSRDVIDEQVAQIMEDIEDATDRLVPPYTNLELYEDIACYQMLRVKLNEQELFMKLDGRQGDAVNDQELVVDLSQRMNQIMNEITRWKTLKPDAKESEALSGWGEVNKLLRALRQTYFNTLKIQDVRSFSPRLGEASGNRAMLPSDSICAESRRDQDIPMVKYIE